jgi:hypothetical protein
MFTRPETGVLQVETGKKLVFLGAERDRGCGIKAKGSRAFLVNCLHRYFGLNAFIPFVNPDL